VQIGAAPVPASVLTALAARMPAARIGRIYGTTESGAISVQWLGARGAKSHTVGLPVLRRSVTIRDRAGRVQPPETWGNVVVDLPVWDGPDGYLEAPPARARWFANARHWTGDRGKLDADGFLVLGARASEIIKVGGRSTSAPAIERALQALGAPAVAVVGLADPLLGQVPVAVYIPDAPIAPVIEAARRRLRADELPRWWLAVSHLPRAALGKLDRRALTAAVHRWTSAFRTSVAIDFEVVPARELDDHHVIADLGPAEGAARTLALVERSTDRVVARAIVDRSTGPRAPAVAPPAFIAALRELMALLP
jgi:acyl-CoA synthetase (AMP-forming)/AMP-acid ligase II